VARRSGGAVAGEQSEVLSQLLIVPLGAAHLDVEVLGKNAAHVSTELVIAAVVVRKLLYCSLPLHHLARMTVWGFCKRWLALVVRPLAGL